MIPELPPESVPGRAFDDRHEVRSEFKLHFRCASDCLITIPSVNYHPDPARSAPAPGGDPSHQKTGDGAFVQAGAHRDLKETRAARPCRGRRAHRRATSTVFR